MKTIVDMPYAHFGDFKDDRILQVEIVDAAPHLAHMATFGINPCSSWWYLSNIETGCQIGLCADITRKKVVANAIAYFAKVTPDDMEKAYRKFLKARKAGLK